MKFLFPAVIVVILSTVRSQSYTDKYDNLDIDEVLGNKRLLTAYIKCMTETGKCTPEGRELKSHITEALKTGCEKCTNKQRTNIRKVIKHLMNNENDAWNQLVEMYDPEKIYSSKYETELQDLGKE